MVTTDTHYREFDRAKGALLGGALGDALGMPTQSCSPDEIVQTFGGITDFAAPVSDHPIAHGLAVATITDDTEQTLLLAAHIIASSEEFDEEGWAHSLIGWEKSVKARGLHDLLGPSTKRALEALLAGISPDETGRLGDTNGAAMRIAPVGISTPAWPVSTLIDHVETTCRITHNTSTAMATASAVAAAISAGVDGAEVEQAAEFALEVTRVAEKRSGGDAGIADRLMLAFEIANRCDETSILNEVRQKLGTSVASAESVPAAFALFKFASGDAWKAGLLAANLGGDTDTIGAIAAGMCGATSGASVLPQDKLTKLTEVNQLNIDDVVNSLLQVRTLRTTTDNPLERSA